MRFPAGFLAFLLMLPATSAHAVQEAVFLSGSAVMPETESLSVPESRRGEPLSEFPDVMQFFLEGPLSPSTGGEESGSVTTESNDPFFGTSGSWGNSYDDLWWLKQVQAPEAWAFTRGKNVTIAVIDTGIDFDHSDLAGSFWENPAEKNGTPGVDDDGNGYLDDIFGWDFYNGDNDPFDDQGHGTHVAGIAAARADNGEGIAGIAPESTILPLKVLNSSGRGFVSDIAQAIRYAADVGAHIINMSLGAWKSQLPASVRQALEEAIAYAVGKGTVIVTSAGNSDTDASLFYPSAAGDVINAAASDAYDNRAWFSNYGDIIDVAAPGVDVLSLRAGGTGFGSSSGHADYSRASGTSMASPVVAGTIALMLSWHHGLHLEEVKKRLHFSALDRGAAGFDIYYGYGRVNAEGAVSQDFYPDGRLMTRWLALPDELDAVHYQYDREGRVTRRTLSSQDYILVDYDPVTGLRRREEFHDLYTIWLRTVEYYEDGITVFREYFPSGDFFEYDRDGNRIEPAASTVIFPAIETTPPTQLFLMSRQTQENFTPLVWDAFASTANFEVEEAGRLPEDTEIETSEEENQGGGLMLRPALFLETPIPAMLPLPLPGSAANGWPDVRPRFNPALFFDTDMEMTHFMPGLLRMTHPDLPRNRQISWMKKRPVATDKL